MDAQTPRVTLSAHKHPPPPPPGTTPASRASAQAPAPGQPGRLAPAAEGSARGVELVMMMVRVGKYEVAPLLVNVRHCSVGRRLGGVRPRSRGSTGAAVCGTCMRREMQRGEPKYNLLRGGRGRRPGWRTGHRGIW